MSLLSDILNQGESPVKEKTKGHFSERNLYALVERLVQLLFEAIIGSGTLLADLV